MQFADLKRWRSFCIHEHAACIYNYLLHLIASTWNISKSSWSLLDIFLKSTLHVLGQVLTKNYDSPRAKFWLNLAMTHSPAAACHGGCRCLQATQLFELATMCYDSVSILGVMAQCALSRHNMTTAMPQVSHAGPNAGLVPRAVGTEMIPLRCQVKSGQVRSSQVKSGQQDKQVNGIAQIATFVLSRETQHFSNLWIDPQVMHSDRQTRAFSCPKTQSL